MYSSTFKNKVLRTYYPNISTLYEFLYNQIKLIQKEFVQISGYELKKKYNIEFLPANTFEKVPKKLRNKFLDNSILGYSTVRFLSK
ncbi:hypothetical protein F8M41_017570 [Gigaspora margarita]|uniref:Uncharacterized protein n=1 Tax=Gigaspora margarita TaxID=4874 RepID=A0A8H3ZZM9_GIGMA|nr:hypothetical protein F8M41_017570 [Gigaspora margarita]